jgi:hypothetical protein
MYRCIVSLGKLQHTTLDVTSTCEDCLLSKQDADMRPPAVHMTEPQFCQEPALPCFSQENGRD